MSDRTRAQILTDLAEAINELTEPRTITEYREVTTVERAVVGSRRKKPRRITRREAHRVTLPGLLESLRTAAVPGSGEAGSAGGGFESRPSAELDPLSVLREITDDVGWYVRAYDIERATEGGRLHALVGLPVTDTELGRIARQAQRWARRARYATGLEPAPMTLDQPCPYCRAKNAIVLAGDLTTGKCTRCGVDWTPDTIGLLADMIRANQEQTTMPATRCWMADCTRRGPHDEHQDGRGRTWSREQRCVDPDGLPVRQ